MKNTAILLFFSIMFYSCGKENPITPELTANEFEEYSIYRGNHYCNRSSVVPVHLSSISFKVKFDSSAIYSTSDPANQYDINKLMGFTEGMDPHHNSARIGWSYNENALRLYAYVYKNGVRESEEICTVIINEAIDCSITATNNLYVFRVNGNEIALSRQPGDPLINGYLLFPYFGGDETAPSDITIYIKDIEYS